MSVEVDETTKIVDGTVIAPGTTFSLNDKAGERTAGQGLRARPGHRQRRKTGTAALHWTYTGLD